MFLRLLLVLYFAVLLSVYSLNLIASAQTSTSQEIGNVLPNLATPTSRDSLVIEFPTPFKSFVQQYALEDALIAVLKEEDAGTFDGPLQALDGSLTHFYIYSHDVAKAIQAISPVLLANGYSHGVIFETTSYSGNGTAKTQRQALKW